MHRIPIYYPVPLSATTAQQAALGEVHPNDGATATTTPICISKRKRKLDGYGGKADPCHAKHLNLHTQTAVDHEFRLPRQVDIMSELTGIDNDLCATLIENEKIRIQICELEAINGQFANCLRGFQDKLNKFADDI
ncbi:hypothetical protein EDB87DRAFT_1574676 [Lactarius vividus]|nr:hypothetical protein EDB87DRAFT_1574676 [Lactarius vividus]